MPSILPRFARTNRLFSLAVFSALFFTGTVYSASPNIPDPSQKGPYDVGFVELDVDVPSQFPPGSIASTKAIVWYPIPAGTSPTEPGPNTSYSMIFEDGVVFPFDSPINALRDAEPDPGAGLFKLVLMMGGGGSIPPPSSVESDLYLESMEILASHGFVVVTYSRRSYADDLIGAVDNAIDIVVQRAVDHEIGGIVDRKIPIYLDEMGNPDKMGIMGHSGGGGHVAQKIVGNGNLIALLGNPSAVLQGPDPHFAAGIYLDSVGVELAMGSDAQMAATKVPYLQIRGSLYEFRGSVRENSDTFFDMTTAVSPRYQLFIRYFDHFVFYTAVCDLLGDFRELSLSVEPGVEPFDFSQLPPSNDAGFITWLLWGPFEDSYGEICETVGVDDSPTTDNHSIRNADGIQDSGPPDGINDYYTNWLLNEEAQDNLPGVDLSTAAVPVNGVNEDFVELLARYQISFFKVHLDKDRRYQPFLTPGFANRDDRVTLKVTGGNGGKKNKNK